MPKVKVGKTPPNKKGGQETALIVTSQVTFTNL